VRGRRTRGAYQPGANPRPLRKATVRPPGGYRRLIIRMTARNGMITKRAMAK
jgi:hypothetical protein